MRPHENGPQFPAKDVVHSEDYLIGGQDMTAKGLDHADELPLVGRSISLPPQYRRSEEWPA